MEPRDDGRHQTTSTTSSRWGYPSSPRSARDTGSVNTFCEGAPAMREQLMERAQALALRLSHLGIGADLACLSVAELWGVYRFMLRLANG